jgi:putative flippase GtrA
VHEALEPAKNYLTDRRKGALGTSYKVTFQQHKKRLTVMLKILGQFESPFLARPTGTVRQPALTTPYDPILIQLSRYMIVSALAFSADFGLLFAFTHYLRINYLISAAFGFSVGVLITYILSTSWVFRRRSVDKKLLEFLIFFMIGIVGLIINEMAIWFLTERLQLYYLYSKVCSVAFVFSWNFFARKITLFR